MKLALITYDSKHLKTEMLVNNFMLQAEDQIDLFALPFVARKSRDIVIHHRPAMTSGAHPKEVAAYYQLNYQTIASVDEIQGDYDYVIIAGAGLLPASFVERYKVINAHPGLIPLVRGLDAFKWALYHHLPLGNSLHYIDAEVDAGEHIKSLATPVYASDSLETLARRHFEFEIALLSNFKCFINQPVQTLLQDVGEARRRMKRAQEEILLENFDAYKAKFVKN